METVKKVYLVGDKAAPDTNEWTHMTASAHEAHRLLEEMGPEGTIKSVDLPKEAK